MNITTIEIPDLNNSPYVISSVVLNNKTYLFEYKWSNRQNIAYLSIYYLSNNSKVFLYKSCPLIIGNQIAKYINDLENWNGILSFYSYNDLELINYTQENISKNYYLKFVTE